MTSKLTKAVDAVKELPQARQDELAEVLYQAATRSFVDEKIAAGEASYATHGGTPAQEVFTRLLTKYAD